MTPQLELDGDRNERDAWPLIRGLIPHYEDFWRQYVYPLRSEGTIWFRNGIDSNLERMAIESYSAFSAFSRARFKIFEDNDGYRQVEELYMLLQRSLEIMVKLVATFTKVEVAITSARPSLNAASIDIFMQERIKPYRNRLHEPLGAQPKIDGVRMIPRLEKLGEYASWTAVMYRLNVQDFVPANAQLNTDFHATASILEGSWKGMSRALRTELNRPKFLAMLLKGVGEPVPIASALSTPASGEIILGSNQIAGSAANFIIEDRSQPNRLARRKQRPIA